MSNLSRYLDECDRDDADDRADDRELARENEPRRFQCNECNGVSHHHPNCPNADDGQDESEGEN